MLLTVTRSACSTGLAHTFLTISNINEAVLAVNSQRVACKLKGNCARATPPNLLLSSSDCRWRVQSERWSHLLGLHLQCEGFYGNEQIITFPRKFCQTWLNCKAEYMHRSYGWIFFPLINVTEESSYAALACCWKLIQICWAYSFKWEQQFVLLGAFLYLQWCLLTLAINY